MQIDIGGGKLPAPGHINLDPNHGEGEWRRLVQDGIPAPDGSVDRVRASHVMEHIPAGDPRIFVLNEVHRVLRPGGQFEVIVPIVVPGTWEAFADPTHVSYWVPESFLYIDGSWAAHADYGMRPWSTVDGYPQTVGAICTWIGVPR